MEIKILLCVISSTHQLIFQLEFQFQNVCSLMKKCENDSTSFLPILQPTGYWNVRLMGGRNSWEGRVEVNINNEWGTVCDDSWSTTDAQVVCRQLGYGSPTSAPGSAHFGQGSGRILLDDVSCTGSESSLVYCSHLGVGSHNCGHSEDASVVCSPGEII